MDILIVNLIICVVLVAVMTAPLGCIGSWNGLAFFGDTLAHASLLGVCISLLLNISYSFGCIIMAFLLALMVARKTSIPKDVTLACISYSCLAVSLIVISKYLKRSVDPNSLLFGDLLSVCANDLVLLGFVAVIVTLFIAVFFKQIQILSFDESLAHVKKIPVAKLRFSLMVGYGLSIGFGIKVLGAFFIPAMALLPAVASRNVSKNPLQMVFIATGISVLSGLLGLFISIKLDWPTGPSIIVVCLFLLFLSKIKPNNR